MVQNSPYSFVIRMKAMRLDVIVNLVVVNMLCLNSTKGDIMSKFEIKGKVALVTGANRGIGAGYVESLIEGGAKRVYATARNIDSLAELAEKNPGIVVPLTLDVTNTEHIQAIKKEINALDILINNAGVLEMSRLSDEGAVEASRREMETNYFGPLELINALSSLLKESKGAAVINVSSIVGISNMASVGTYSVSKAALHSSTQGFRADFEQYGIQVIGVYPGPVDTRMAENFDMEKPESGIVARATFAALRRGEVEVFPDPFAETMYATFLKNPRELEQAFSGNS